VTARAPRRLTAPGLAARLLVGQLLVVLVGAITLAVTAVLVAPGLFHQHLDRSGVITEPVRQHAEEAFTSALLIALTVAVAAALLTAGVVSWLVVRGVSRPVEQLAAAADAVAEGRYHVAVPTVPFTSELQRLSDAFGHMATRLADTDVARSRLLSDLSHELRTPLATLAVFVDGLEDGVVPADAAAFATMRHQVDRLQRLASDVREVARAEEDALDLHPGLVDPVDLADTAVAAAAPRYTARGVALRTVHSGPVPPVRGDDDRLQQVLGNLLDNALQHTPAGGHVTIDVTAHAVLHAVTITVTDDGAGIPVDQLDSIFDRFHRADPARSGADGSGSGLGLTIARAIVHAHGGTITAHSRGPGTGAAFTLTLPAEP
jgi:two-component system sensor histidine kinase BaeS